MNKKETQDEQEEFEQENFDLEHNESESAIEGDLEQVTKEDNLTRAYKQLYGDENLEKITELGVNDIGKISILLTYAKKFHFTELENLIKNNLRLRVSKGRKGREEHVKVAQAEIVREQDHIKFAKSIDKRIER